MDLHQLAKKINEAGFVVKAVNEADPFDETDSEIEISDRVHVQVGECGCYAMVNRWTGVEGTPDYGLIFGAERKRVDGVIKDLQAAVDLAEKEDASLKVTNDAAATA